MPNCPVKNGLTDRDRLNPLAVKKLGRSDIWFGLKQSNDSQKHALETVCFDYSVSFGEVLFFDPVRILHRTPEVCGKV